MGFARWFRLGIGLLLVIVPLWALFTRLDAIWNGHPAYPTALLVTVAIGLAFIAFALWPWRRDPEPAGPPWERDDPADGVVADAAGQTASGRDSAPTPAPADPTVHAPPRRRHGWRIAGRIALTIVALVWVGFLGWLRPFTAGPDALAALQSDAAVTVVDISTSIELRPSAPVTPQVGLVFSPGARVDARAYAAALRPVAEAGYPVIILKEPFGLAITSINAAAGPIADHPEIADWAVGGHSLGGVSAAWFAADHRDTVDGLLLWASYSNDDMSGDVTLQVASISGSNDALATPADIEKSAANLPPDTTFTVIEGGVHAFFADYGEQPGDGQPTIDRATASQQIATASIAFMDRLRASVPAG